MQRLRKFIAEHPYVNVIRYTTFFHQFTLVFDELQREKYVDWYGYSASVSPYILEQFEREAGYKFRPEFIIDQGYYNNPVSYTHLAVHPERQLDGGRNERRSPRGRFRIRSDHRPVAERWRPTLCHDQR